MEFWRVGRDHYSGSLAKLSQQTPASLERPRRTLSLLHAADRAPPFTNSINFGNQLFYFLHF